MPIQRRFLELLAAGAIAAAIAGPASAAPFPVTGPSPAQPLGIVKVQTAHEYYRTRPNQQMRNYGGRYNGTWRGRYNYYGDGGDVRQFNSRRPSFGRSAVRRPFNAGAAAAAGIVGLATGAIAGSALNAAPNVGNGDWVAYCSQKYRSFDPASGTYLGYDGQRHACR